MEINSFESSVPSLTSKIQFVEVQSYYSFNEDLICSYTLVNCEPKEHDRVAIYKIGWLFAKDFEVFEWAPVDIGEKLRTVIFQRHHLPKNTDDIYQFCYISGDNTIYGASSPFQFSQQIPRLYSIATTERPSLNSTYSNNSIEHIKSSDKDKEIQRLREENTLLKDTLRAVVNNKNSNRLQSDVDELTRLVKMLKNAVLVQQSEINGLKEKLNVNVEKAEPKKVLAVFPQKLSDIGELETLPPFPLGN